MNTAYLPSKKIFWFLGGCVVVIGLVLFTTTTDKSSDTLDGVDIISNASAGSDIDGDGLLDWEEELWRTDPKNPDTDGDGTPDGEEVDNNRHPNVARPNDEITESQKQSVYVTARARGVDLPKNKTKEVFDYLLPEALARAAKSTGVEEVELTDLEPFLENYAQELVAGKENPRWDSKDVQTRPDGDAVLYTDTVLSTILPFAEQENFGKEMQLAAQFFAVENDQEAREVIMQLQDNADTYREVAEALIDTEVPVTFADTHLALANTHMDISRSIAEMAVAASAQDPVSLLASIEWYRSLSDNITYTFAGLGQQLITP